MQRYAFYILTFLWSVTLSAQESYMLVYFTDKGDTATVKPSVFLSEPALLRRQKQNIPVTYDDYPVRSEYINSVAGKGYRVIHVLKWINAVCVEKKSDSRELASLSFVKDVVPLKHRQMRAASLCMVNIETNGVNTDNQLQMIGLDVMHAHGFTGKGVRIAVFDNGFENIDRIKAFSRLLNEGRVEARKNFVDTGIDPFRVPGGSHGGFVLSVLAGYDRAQAFYGSAYDATYLLAVTEDIDSETELEEINWARAAEWADSAGADIISSSLGYANQFTDSNDHHYEDMDGNTTIVTNAADKAAAKGILVVNSAGNEGDKRWIYITAPADGDSVMAVGGVDANRICVSFSSVGPTYDGRIKPNVTARAGKTVFAIGDTYTGGNGTSYSCPLVSGLAACLWQTDTMLGNMQLFDYIQRSADRYEAPDYYYGYGIPSAPLAYRMMKGQTLEIPLVKRSEVKLYPNPAKAVLRVARYDEDDLSLIRLTFTDMQGKESATCEVEGTTYYRSDGISLEALGLKSGLYFVKVYVNDAEPFMQKIWIVSE